MRKQQSQPTHWTVTVLFVLVALILAIPSLTYAPHNNHIVLQIFHKNNMIAIATGLLTILWAGIWLWHAWQNYANAKTTPTANKGKKRGSAKKSSKKVSLSPYNTQEASPAHWLNPRLVSLVSLSWFAVIVWASLSYFWSDNSGHFFEKATFFWAAAALFYFVHIIIQDARYRQWLLYALLIAAVGVSFYGILQYTFGYDKIIGRAHPSSTFGNRNVSSHVIVLVLPLIFYLLVGKKHSSTTQTVGLLLSLMLMFTYVFVTTARGPWGGVLIATITFAAMSLLLKKRNAQTKSSEGIWHNLSKRNGILLAGFIIIGIALASAQHDDKTGRIVWTNPVSLIQSNVSQSLDAGIGSDSSANKRITTWKTIGAQAFSDAPLLGHGLGSFHYIAEDYFTKFAKGMYSLHNDHLQYAVELGSIGALLITIAALVTLYAIATLLLSTHISMSEKLLISAILGSLLATSFNALFSFPYQHAVPTVTLAVLLAYINTLYIQHKTRAANIAQDTNQDTERTFPAKHIALGALLCIPFAFFMVALPLHWNSIYWTFEKQLTDKRWKDIDYKPYSYNRYVRSMLRTTMRSYGKRNLDRQRIKAAGNFLTHFPHSEGLSSWAAQVARQNKDYATAATYYEMAVRYAPKGDINALKQLDAMNRYYLKTPEKTLPLIDATLERHSEADLATKNDNYLQLGKMYQFLKQNDKAREMYLLGQKYHPKHTGYKKQLDSLK